MVEHYLRVGDSQQAVDQYISGLSVLIARRQGAQPESSLKEIYNFAGKGIEDLSPVDNATSLIFSDTNNRYFQAAKALENDTTLLGTALKEYCEKQQKA